MAEGKQYVVSVKMIADDEDVRKALDSLNSKSASSASEATSKAIDGVRLYRDSFQQMSAAYQGFRSQLGFVTGMYQRISAAVGFGFKDIVTGAIEVNSDLETLQTGLAAVLSTIDNAGGGPFAHFADAQKEVMRLLPMMREDAASTGASFEDIAQAFTTVLPFARDLTTNLQDLEKLAANSTFWDTVTGRRGATALDVRQVLSGQLNPRIIQNAALNKDLTELKKLYQAMANLPDGADQKAARQRLFERIVKDLTPSTEAQTAISKSFRGMKLALEGELKALFQEGTSPIWNDLKNLLSELNAWVRTPAGMAKIREYAADFAAFVKGAAGVLKDVFMFFYNNWGAVKSVFEGFMKVWALKNVMLFIGALEGFAAAIASGTFSDFIRALMGFKTGGALGGVARGVAGAEAAAGAAGAAAGAEGSAAAVGAAALLARVAMGAAAGALFLEPGDHRMTADEAGAQAAGLQRRANRAGLGQLPDNVMTDPEAFGVWNRFTADMEKVNAAVEATLGTRRIVVPLFTVAEAGKTGGGPLLSGPGSEKIIQNRIVLELKDGKLSVASIEKGPTTDIQVGTSGVGKGGDL